MLTRVRRRMACDAGISLVEMLIAIVVLGVILTGLATTLMASLVSLHGDELRVRGSQLANHVIEELQATPWDRVGFFADDPDYTDEFDGHETVTLGAARDGEPGPAPTSVIPQDDVDYQVTRNITWVEDSGEGEERLKAFDVLIEWSERGTPRSHSVRALRAPTPDELAVSADDEDADFEITFFMVAPQPVTLIAGSNNTEGSIEIRVSTSLPADPPKLSIPLTGDQWTLQEDEGAGAPEGTAWTWTIPAGAGQFDPGSYEFVVDADAVPPSMETDQAIETVWFVIPSDEPMEIQDPRFEPGPFCRRQVTPRTTYFAVTVEFEVHGASAADSAHLKVDGVEEEIAASHLEDTDDGALFEATVPAETRLRKNTASLVLRASRQVDSEEATLAYSASIETASEEEDCSGFGS